MSAMVAGKTPRKAVAGGRFHTIGTSTPSKSNLKVASVRAAPEISNGITPRGGDIFDLAAAELDDPAGCKHCT